MAVGTKPLSPALFAVGLCLVLGSVCLLEITSSIQDSQTHDEAAHIVAGYSYWKTGDFRLNLEHPPFSKLLSSLPLLLLNPTFGPPADAWRAADEFSIGRDFLYHNRVPADTLLLATRAVIIVVSLVLGLSVAVWVRARAGTMAGIIATVILLLEPTVLAHSRYVTSDIPVTLFIWLTWISWYSYLEQPSAWKLGRTATLTGLAIATKFNALVLYPIFILSSLAERRKFSTPDKAFIALVLVLAPFVVVLVAYGFDTRSLAADPVLSTRLQTIYPVTRTMNSYITQALLHIPIPGYYFFRGFQLLLRHTRSGHLTYLMGVISQRGSWKYFPLAMLVKSSTGWLLLLFTSLGLVLFRKVKRQQTDMRLAYALLVPASAYFAVSLFSPITIGIRHLLPIYPFLCAFIGVVLFKERSGRKLTVAVISLLLLIGESLNAYPNYLAFFNAVSGGNLNGHRYLLDSNLDWGQDLKRLKTWVDSHHAAPLCLSYFGTADPSYYGIIYEPLPRLRASQEVSRLNCIVAVSAEHLFGLEEAPFAALQSIPTLDRVGGSIYIYDLRRAIP
jgi:Dolichyl-phosphate-mannose-protein mannosyltransferase